MISKSRSVPYYRRVVELDSQHQPAWRELGYRLIEHANTRNEGLEALKRAVALDPSDRWSRMGLAVGFELDGQLEEAECRYKEATEMFPDDDYIIHCLTTFRSSRRARTMPQEEGEKLGE